MGRLQKMSLPNGSQRDYSFAPTGELKELRHSWASDGRLIALTKLEHDLAGRPTRRLGVPFDYDKPAASFSGEYLLDNILIATNGLSNSLDLDGNLTFGYDPLHQSVMSFAYNHRSWMTLSQVKGRSASYLYDSEGRRLERTVDGATERFVLDDSSGLSQAIVRQEIGGANRRQWGVFAPGYGLLYEVESVTSTGGGGAGGVVETLRVHHYDQVGNTVVVTDEQQRDVLWVRYDPYGAVTHAESPTQRDGSLPVRPELNLLTDKLDRALAVTPYLFTGQYGVMTDANGLIHMRARYYHPGIRRFLNADPIRFEGGMNWFAYANGDPLMRSDPSGLSPAWQISNPAGYWDPSVRAMEQSAEYKEGYRQGMGQGAIAGLAIAAAVFAPELYAAYPAATTVGAAGVTLGVAGQGASDLYRGSLSGANEYIGAGVGGGVVAAGTFVSGGTAPALLTMVGWGAAGAAAGNLVEQGLGSKPFSSGELLWDTGFGAASGLLGNFGGPAVSGFTSGRGSWLNVANTQLSRHFNGTAVNMSATTAGKIFGTQVYGSAGNILLDGFSDATKSDFFLPRK